MDERHLPGERSGRFGTELRRARQCRFELRQCTHLTSETLSHVCALRHAMAMLSPAARCCWVGQEMSHMLLPEAVGGRNIQKSLQCPPLLSVCALLCAVRCRWGITSPYTPELRVRQSAVTARRSTVVNSISDLGQVHAVVRPICQCENLFGVPEVNWPT